MNCSLLELCKCGEGQICLPCMMVAVVCIAAISGFIGYFIGKKRRVGPDQLYIAHAGQKRGHDHSPG